MSTNVILGSRIIREGISVTVGSRITVTLLVFAGEAGELGLRLDLRLSFILES